MVTSINTLAISNNLIGQWLDHNFPNRRWKMAQMNLEHMAALTTEINRIEVVLQILRTTYPFKAAIIIQISNLVRKMLKVSRWLVPMVAYRPKHLPLWKMNHHLVTPIRQLQWWPTKMRTDKSPSTIAPIHHRPCLAETLSKWHRQPFLRTRKLT